MASEHKVISLNDTFDWPQALQWPSSQRKQITERLEGMLDEMSREGWEFVATCAIGSMISAIFRRDAKK